MAGKFSLSRIFKPWSVKDSASKTPLFDEKSPRISLLPIFNIESNQFDSVFFDFSETLNAPNGSKVIQLVEQCLKKIDYWHCHGRAIRCILPIYFDELRDSNIIDQIEQILIESKFPIGLITFNLTHLNKTNLTIIENNIHRLIRLGINFEVLLTTNINDDLGWISSNLFKGIHLPIEALREINQSEKELTQLTEFIKIKNTNNFHNYCRDIALVHDLSFAKKIGIKFCYGPLMMSAVSKHQILKIKESQFAKFENNPTPSFNITNGEHR